MFSRIDWGQIVAPMLAILILVGFLTFGHSALYGQHGLSAQRDAHRQAEDMTAELDALRAERERLENLVMRLGPNHLDLDLLDERARQVLGYSRTDEIIIE